MFRLEKKVCGVNFFFLLEGGTKPFFKQVVRTDKGGKKEEFCPVIHVRGMFYMECYWAKRRRVRLGETPSVSKRIA